MPISGISSLLENLILLRYVESGSELHRVLSVLKVRDSGFDPSLRKFLITGQGIEIGEPLRGEDLLTGSAHETHDPRTGRQEST